VLIFLWILISPPTTIEGRLQHGFTDFVFEFNKTSGLLSLPEKNFKGHFLADESSGLSKHPI
jgi:hypothetical protein